MNAYVALLFLWPHSFEEQHVDIRQLPEYKTWIVHLQEGTDDQKIAAADALRNYDRDAQPALGALRHALQKTENLKVAEMVTMAIEDIGPTAKAAVPDLEAAVAKKLLPPPRALEAAFNIGALPEPLVRLAIVDLLAAKVGPRPVRVLERAAYQRPVFVLETLLEYLPKWDEEVAVRAVHSLVGGFDDLLVEEQLRGVPIMDVRLNWVTPALLQQAEQTLASWLTDARQERFYMAASLLMMLDPTKIDAFYPLQFENQSHNPNAPTLTGLLPLQWFRMYPFLLTKLDDLSEQARHHAEATLRHFLMDDVNIGRATVHRARACVLTGLRHPLPVVREKVLDLLKDSIVDDDLVAASFVVALRDPEPQIRFTAAYWLHRERWPTNAVVPVLQELAQSHDPDMRIKAIDLLAEHGPTARLAIPALLRLTKHPHASTQAHAILAVAMLDSLPTFLLHHAKALLESKELAIQHQTIILLARLGPTAKAYLEPLQTMLQNKPQPYTECLLRLAIAMLEPKEIKATLGHFTNLLQSGSIVEITHAVNALARLPAFSAKQFLPTLSNVVAKYSDTNWADIAAQLAVLCLRLEPTDNDTLAVFTKELERVDRSPWLRHIELMQEHAKPLLPMILQAYIKAKTDESRRQLLHVLNGLGPHAESLASELAKHADGPLAPYVRHTIRAITREVRP